MSFPTIRIISAINTSNRITIAINSNSSCTNRRRRTSISSNDDRICGGGDGGGSNIIGATIVSTVVVCNPCFVTALLVPNISTLVALRLALLAGRGCQQVPAGSQELIHV